MRVIRHVFELDAPREQVWFALTDPEGLRGWWSTRLESPRPAVGVLRQLWTFQGDFNPVMEITVLVPPERLGWTCVGGHGNWTDYRLTFELGTDGGTRTVVRVWRHAARELDDDASGTDNFNWGHELEASACSRRPVAASRSSASDQGRVRQPVAPCAEHPPPGRIGGR